MQTTKFQILREKNLDISAKFCPVCKNKNDRDAVICVHCGSPLEMFLNDSATTRTTEVQSTNVEDIAELLLDESLIPVGGIAIYVEGSSKPVFSSSDTKFVIGRKMEEIPGPFLDLSRFGGYHLGLSRQHVIIQRAKQGYEVIDLASSNGTWLNDERLIPNKPYPLASGSQLRLARMRLFVLYRLETKEKTQ